jgi:RNA polymerase sigma factor (sigma-70 family)
MGRVYADGGPIAEGLIAPAQAGDLAAQRELYEQVRPYVRFVVASLTGRISDLEELCQECCAQILTNLYRYRGAGKFTTWVCAVSARRVRRWRTRVARDQARRDLARDLASLQVGPHADDRLLLEEVVAAADEAIRRLPRRMYLALVMLDILGLPPAEASKVIGGTPRSLTNAAYRAKKHIRKHFARLGLLDQPQGAELAADMEGVGDDGQS